jgi:septal ring factor EnvC (AmiA/AmiB activator)
MSKLEQFIKDNRPELDDATPSAKVWENVEVAMNGKKKKIFTLAPILKWSAAAAVLIMVVLGAYFIIKKDKAGDKTPEISKSNIISVPDAPEVNQFAQLIALKQEELKTLGKEQPELYQQFTADITQLDSSYNALKNQLSNTPNREVLIEAMIQNLQLQLNVLNQQLNIIHQIKQSKNYSHEKNDQHI